MKIRMLAVCATIALTSLAHGQQTTPFAIDGFTVDERCQENNTAVDNCVIWVTVKGSAATCQVTVDADQELVTMARNRGKMIFWKLTADSLKLGYKFTADGVIFKNDKDRNFKAARVLQGGDAYRWKNSGKAPRIFEYTIKVAIDGEDLECQSEDPWIRNRV